MPQSPLRHPGVVPLLWETVHIRHPLMINSSNSQLINISGEVPCPSPQIFVPRYTK